MIMIMIMIMIIDFYLQTRAMKGRVGKQKEFDENDDPIRIEITDTLVHKQVIRLLLVAAEKSLKPHDYVSGGSNF